LAVEATAEAVNCCALVNKRIAAHLAGRWELRWAVGLATVLVFASGFTSEAAATPINLVCEVETAFPMNGFGHPTAKSRSRIRVVLDADKKTGAYDGHFGIRSDRPGQLEMTDDFYVVIWSGTLEILNSVIVEERLILNRFTGRLFESLKLGDGRIFGLVEGTCTKSEGQLF
jgi:hypothetical protein